MPELPEIISRAREMRKVLVGKTITNVRVLQPKCLNVSENVFVDALTDAEIERVTSRGKWIFTRITTGWWLLCLGMGGEILFVTPKTLPEKYRIVLYFTDNSCLAINFWWFGYSHFVKNLINHPMTADLGPDALALSLDAFSNLLQNRRGGIKSFLLNQKRIAGIGNVYVQDPLFLAGIHPLRKINTLDSEDVFNLWQAIQSVLEESVNLVGAKWEMNLFGDNGQWDEKHFHIAYKDGSPCPKCGSIIEKIKTGSTSSYICPTCQPLK